MEKKEIRREIRQKRSTLSSEELKKQSHRICIQLLRTELFLSASCIYAYIDCREEAMTQELICAAWAAGKRVAVPKVFGEELRFFYIRSYEELESGAFGISEPKENLREAMEEDALMLVPGVAFDRERHRCGSGKGFYDRYLAAHPDHPTIALALDFQILDAVPAEPYDRSPQMLITPSAVY